MADETSPDGKATQLFNEFNKQVYQIRVIDIASGDKSSIGSGFQVSADGYMATNFHVVSSFIHEPEKYRLEYVSHNGVTGPLEVKGVDVIHDLAVLKAKKLAANHFQFRLESIAKGDRIFSMGNPQDLGMTIIEGNYNGLVKNSRFKKILFSGSLNPGMSGGPALDINGNIIGVNVSKATRGEQLSFLVPVQYLNNLVKQVETTVTSDDSKQDKNFKKIIESTLHKDQDEFFKKISSQPFLTDSFGDLKLPTKLSPTLNCWGHSVDDEEIKYNSFHQHCKLDDQIYIDNDFYTGDFSYDYEWLTTSKLNPLQFYDALEQRYSHIKLYNSSGKKHTTAYQCKSDFVNIAESSWKISSCFRAYKSYKGLYDALLLMALVDRNDKAAILKIGAAGISKQNATLLFKKFMESIEWQH
ncbi:trypsin-like peptidase domain-containing protein [Endozoicomonas sp. SM1973]|uniref:Trypsin-like peptidase domain-containing protein n=1 Tax=Spartinivicinus marinus TaxID=2994442 RepID=A0A853I9N0_9GAMM|nr:serine protease [Spartinivicinus marinus]MCX4026881.1 serine protease [Spartinivicinus marinus]NYZ66774.1 trypsin-like peptidase domain-containing protein [Spartinivicinus marinus]